MYVCYCVHSLHNMKLTRCNMTSCMNKINLSPHPPIPHPPFLKDQPCVISRSMLGWVLKDR